MLIAQPGRESLSGRETSCERHTVSTAVGGRFSIEREEASFIGALSGGWGSEEARKQGSNLLSCTTRHIISMEKPKINGEAENQWRSRKSVEKAERMNGQTETPHQMGGKRGRSSAIVGHRHPLICRKRKGRRFFKGREMAVRSGAQRLMGKAAFGNSVERACSSLPDPDGKSKSSLVLFVSPTLSESFCLPPTPPTPPTRYSSRHSRCFPPLHRRQLQSSPKVRGIWL